MKSAAPFELGIVAADIDALLPFYIDVLGLALIGDTSVPAGISRRAGLAPDGYRVVRLQTTSGDCVKLAAPAGAPPPRASERFAMQRGGLAYLTLIVEDLAELRDRLEYAGARIASEGVVDLRPGVRLLLAADPEGNWLEFLEYDDIAAYRAIGTKR